MPSGVEFDEDNLSYGRPASARPGMQPSAGGRYQPQQQTGMAAWLVKHGLAKSSKSAQFVLLIVVVVNIIITYVLIKFFL